MTTVSAFRRDSTDSKFLRRQATTSTGAAAVVNAMHVVPWCLGLDFIYGWTRAQTHTQRHSSYSATHVIDVPGYQMKCNVSSSNNNQNKKQNVVYFLRISVRLDSLARLVINQRIDWTTHLIDFISQQNGYIIINTYIGISTEQPMTHSHTHTWSRQGRVVAGRLRVDEHTWFC